VGGDRFDTHIWLTFSYYIKEFLTSDTDAVFPIPLILSNPELMFRYFAVKGPVAGTAYYATLHWVSFLCPHNYWFRHLELGKMS